MGQLLAVLLPPHLRYDDDARAALDWLGDVGEALTRLGAPAHR